MEIHWEENVLAVNDLWTGYYRLTEEQIIAQHRKNASGTWDKAGEGDGVEESGGISREGVPRLDDTLKYYYELCREFGNYSFQLGDRESGAGKDSGKLFTGISTDATQVGDDYSHLGQVSIEIDIDIIRRMQVDPAFEKKVKSAIKQIGENYEQYQQTALKGRHQYTAVQIYDDHGNIMISQICSDHSFKTEAEALEEIDPWKAYWEAYFDKLKNDMLEDFFEKAIDYPREKMLKEKMEHREDDSLFSEKALEPSDDWKASDGLEGIVRDRRKEMGEMLDHSSQKLEDFRLDASGIGENREAVIERR